MEELDTLMASGKQCEQSECSVDDVDMLIGELLDQQKELYNRVKQLKTEIKLLEELNEGERDVDEIQETVRAIARIFQLGVSQVSCHRLALLISCNSFVFHAVPLTLIVIFRSNSSLILFAQAKASGNDYPALSRPTGYSGEVGDGPKTAFDVLDPKKA